MPPMKQVTDQTALGYQGTHFGDAPTKGIEDGPWELLGSLYTGRGDQHKA